MPVFVIKAKDKLAVKAVIGYQERCLEAGLDHQADEVRKAVSEIVEWQRRNPALVQTPDHDHVPAASVPSHVRTRCLEFALALGPASGDPEYKATRAVAAALVLESYVLGVAE
jgi:hypothetical protein